MRVCRRSGPCQRAIGSQQPARCSTACREAHTPCNRGALPGRVGLQGALVANYPWDGTADESTRYEACPDDATFRHLAAVYASTHQTMALANNTVGGPPRGFLPADKRLSTAGQPACAVPKGKALLCRRPLHEKMGA